MSVGPLRWLVAAALVLAAGPAPASAAGPGDLYVEAPGNGGSDAHTCGQLDPCATVARALSAADAGSTIHVGVGTFDGAIQVDKSLAIEGVSSDQTVLTKPQDSAPDYVVGVTAGTTHLSNLTIHGVLFADVFVGGTGTVAGDHVVLAEAECALVVESGAASLTDSTVKDGRQGGCLWPPLPSGEIVVIGGSVALTRTQVLSPAVRDPAVRVVAGAFTADQSYFDDSAHDWDYNGSHAIHVEGGTATVTRSTFHGFDTGVLNAGGTAMLADDTFQHNIMGVTGQSGSTTVVRTTFQGGLGALQSNVSIAGSVIGPHQLKNCNRNTIIDLGYNLTTDHSCGLTASTSRQDVTDLNLDSGLADHGGPVPTLATRSPSAAIDAIPAGATYGDLAAPLCPAGGTTDLRGVPRPQAGACDAGSMELLGTTTTLSAPTTAEPYARVALNANVDLMAAGAGGGELPAGTVTFRSGAEVLCEGPVVNGGAQCTTWSLTEGPQSLTARFTPTPGSTLHPSVSSTSTILVGTQPWFASKSKARFVVGKARAFQVRASGSPAPLITLIKGHLPAGLRLQGGTGLAILRGSARRATVGTHRVTLQAANLLGADELVLRIIVVRP